MLFYLLGFVPRHNRRQAYLPQACEESERCKYQGCDQELPFVQQFQNA